MFVGLLEGLGFGQKVVVAAILGIFVIYLFRGKKAAGTFVGLMGTLWVITISILGALILAILFGWVDPNPTKFLSDMQAWAEIALDLTTNYVADIVKTVLEDLI